MPLRCGPRRRASIPTRTGARFLSSQLGLSNRTLPHKGTRQATQGPSQKECLPAFLAPRLRFWNKGAFGVPLVRKVIASVLSMVGVTNINPVEHYSEHVCSGER